MHLLPENSSHVHFSSHHHTVFFRFDGRVVAKLPFVPHSWLQGLSHRNLMGTDFTDCSFIFLYILCTMSVRQVCAKTFFAEYFTKLVGTDHAYIDCTPIMKIFDSLQMKYED